MRTNKALGLQAGPIEGARFARALPRQRALRLESSTALSDSVDELLVQRTKIRGADCNNRAGKSGIFTKPARFSP